MEARQGFAAAAGPESARSYTSSVGVLACRRPQVDESWPRRGSSSSTPATDEVERSEPSGRSPPREWSARPGRSFKREAASEIRRRSLVRCSRGVVRRRLIPVVPAHPRLVFQAVHSHDVGHAYRLALMNEDARGAFNIAAEPVLDPPGLGRVLGARAVRVPGGLLRGGAALSYRLRLQPSEPGWVDMGLGVPLMDVSRARSELGWSPERSAFEPPCSTYSGASATAGFETPAENRGAGPLRARSSRAEWRENGLSPSCECQRGVTGNVVSTRPPRGRARRHADASAPCAHSSTGPASIPWPMTRSPVAAEWRHGVDRALEAVEGASRRRAYVEGVSYSLPADLTTDPLPSSWVSHIPGPR